MERCQKTAKGSPEGPSPLERFGVYPRRTAIADAEPGLRGAPDSPPHQPPFGSVAAMTGASETRDRILDAAERLYAEKGLEGVSLREVGDVAGQRNTGAVHYHFGGRDGLVEALFERRFASIDARRGELLDQLDAEGRGDDLAALVRVLVEPFTEGMDGTGGYWVRFVARLHEDPRSNPFGAPGPRDGGAGDGGEGAEAALPYRVPAEVTRATVEVSARIRRVLGGSVDDLDARFFAVTTMVVHAAADHEALVAAGRAPAGLERADQLGEYLVRASIALFSAP
jgi:AcrR family transcriptional regulator